MCRTVSPLLRQVLTNRREVLLGLNQRFHLYKPERPEAGYCGQSDFIAIFSVDALRLPSVPETSD